MQRSLSVLLRFLDIRILYAVMALVIPFYMLFAHKGYISIYHFYRQGFGYSPLKSFFYVYANHFKFGQVILDRFSFYAGNRFNLDIEGMPLWDELNNREEGFVQLASHLGNYELAGYSLKSQNKMFYALVYSGETETVMRNRSASFDGNNIEMIPVADDLSHMIRMSTALSEGHIVSISADRIFGSPRSVTCSFLGKNARFPLGPFAIAVQKNVPVVAVFVVKTSTKGYKIIIRRIEPDLAGLGRTQKMEAYARDFVKELETLTRQYPCQWFNFFEFWQQ